MNWISVKEGLPEPWVDVLVYCKNLRMELAVDLPEKYFAIDRWCIWTDDFPPGFRTTRFKCEVTHWTPLPEPPKQT